MSKSEGSSNFEPISDPTIIKTFLVEAVKTHASTTYWTKNQTQLIQDMKLSFPDREQTLVGVSLPEDFDATQFVEDLKSGKIEECYFSVSLPRAHIFFKARFHNHSLKGLVFKTPDKIFKVQRRTDLRIPLETGYWFPCSYPDPEQTEKRIERKVMDISASGLAFMAAVEEQPHFPQGLVIEGLSFSIQGKRISTDFEVKHAKVFVHPKRFGRPESQGLKVGGIFRSMKAADKQAIAAFVFEESRKYFSRIY